jgi:hypothetical protein
MYKYKLTTTGWWFDSKAGVTYNECYIMADEYIATGEAYLFVKNKKVIFEITKCMVDIEEIN